jgi:G3E family GTPase
MTHSPSGAVRVPVSLITGFLGSGKTTLLNQLLQQDGLGNSLVIINEFGEVGIDHLLVSVPSENMRLLANGCLCCAVRGDLVETLADAHRKREEKVIPAFDRVLVETTGLADPVPIIQTLVTDEAVAPFFRLDTVIAVVDSLHARGQLDVHREAVKQIAVADLLLLSKTDISDPSATARLIERLRDINQTADIVSVARGGADPAVLFGRATLGVDAQPNDVERWLGGNAAKAVCMKDSHDDCGHTHADGEHDDRVQTFTVYHDAPTSSAGLAAWLTLLASFSGAHLLRVKGLINVEGRPVVVQAVQCVIHEPVELGEWPCEDRRSRVVFIVRDGDRASFERSLQALAMTTQKKDPGMLDPAAYARFAEVAATLHQT